LAGRFVYYKEEATSMPEKYGNRIELPAWVVLVLLLAAFAGRALAEEAAGGQSVAVIGGADGPTAIYVTSGGLPDILEAQLPWYSFGPMDEQTLNDSVARLGDISDNYNLTGRVSLDSQYGYIAGVLKVSRNPAAEGRGAADRLSDGSRVFYNADSPGVLIVVPGAYAREKGFGLEYNELYGYATGGDMEYLRDATRRGVTVCAPPVPYLSVHLQENGKSRYEYIRLTEADLKAAASDQYVFKSETIGDSISLITSDAKVEYGESVRDIPVSLYAMAAERCGFTVASPNDIGTIVRATMTITTRQGETSTQVIEDKEALKKLASILTRARKTDLSNCPFTAVLTMVMKDGRVVTVHKATDSCDTLVFGSAMCYEISEKANAQFWKIFADIHSIVLKQTN
jgi:hypothetical protein